MVLYQIRIVVEENKFDEFVDTLLQMSKKICNEEGCLDFNLYSDIEKEDAYILLVEWKTLQKMEKHFKRKLFSTLIGMTKVLGSDFDIKINEILEKGTYTLVQEKIALAPQRRKKKKARKHQQT